MDNLLFEPETSISQPIETCTAPDSNRERSRYERGALTIELAVHKLVEMVGLEPTRP